MMDMMIAIPPIHLNAATSSDVAFWVMIGLAVVVFLAVTTLWVIGSRSIARRQSQVKEVEWHYEAFPQPQSEVQPQVHTQEEEKVLLPR